MGRTAGLGAVAGERPQRRIDNEETGGVRGERAAHVRTARRLSVSLHRCCCSFVYR